MRSPADRASRARAPVAIEGLGAPIDIFAMVESNVRSYCRKFPVVFATAKNAIIVDESGRQYVDFFAGAGALNYGHNNDSIKKALIEYIASDGVGHSLDLHTVAKREFLRRFHDVILGRRGYTYKVQFTGPTGTNSVEAALKLARKVTGRETVIAFTNAFHGMSLGSLAVSARSSKRASAGVSLDGVVRMPFDNYFGKHIDTIDVIESMIFKAGSGVDLPAAFILETLQAEGGLNVASETWLKRLAGLAKKHGVLLIIDDIQAGCGRTGTFFSFERAGVTPDMVCLSKSIGGYGLPMALLLIRPEFDCWEPGEHNGTFRGNNLAFVAATAALDFWSDGKFEAETAHKAALLHRSLLAIAATWPEAGIKVRGCGLLQGLAFEDPTTAASVSKRAFDAGLIVELCGSRNEVVKIMPPLTIERDVLSDGLSRLADAVETLRQSSLAPHRMRLFGSEALSAAMPLQHPAGRMGHAVSEPT
jgi:diaminobutyrate-2-oxoglutarate transaminase